MGRTIVKLDGKYLEWSSVSDGPATSGMTRAEFEEWYLACNGTNGMRDLADRLERADRIGTSLLDATSVDDVLWPNRAGPGEMLLTKGEIIEWYVRRKQTPTRAEIMARRATLPKCDPCTGQPRADGCRHRCVCWGTGVREP